MALQGAPQVAVGNQSPQLAGVPLAGHPAGPHPVGGEVGNQFRQGGARFQGPQVCGAHHQVGGGQRQLLTQGTGRMVEGKILGRDAPPFHPHRRQGIANGHGHRCAGGGGQVERTHLAIHRGIENHVTTPRQAGVNPAHQGNPGGAPAAEVGQDFQHLLGFAAVGKQQGDIVWRHHPQVAVQGIDRVQKDGHQADGGEGGGDFARHDPTFPHSRDHELGAGRGAAIQQLQGGFHLLAI